MVATMAGEEGEGAEEAADGAARGAGRGVTSGGAAATDSKSGGSSTMASSSTSSSIMMERSGGGVSSSTSGRGAGAIGPAVPAVGPAPESSAAATRGAAGHISATAAAPATCNAAESSKPREVRRTSLRVAAASDGCPTFREPGYRRGISLVLRRPIPPLRPAKGMRDLPVPRADGSSPSRPAGSPAVAQATSPSAPVTRASLQAVTAFLQRSSDGPQFSRHLRLSR